MEKKLEVENLVGQSLEEENIGHAFFTFENHGPCSARAPCQWVFTDKIRAIITLFFLLNQNLGNLAPTLELREHTVPKNSGTMGWGDCPLLQVSWLISFGFPPPPPPLPGLQELKSGIGNLTQHGRKSSKQPKRGEGPTRAVLLPGDGRGYSLAKLGRGYSLAKLG